MAIGAAVAISFVIFILILTLGGSLLSSMQASTSAALGAGNATAWFAAGNGSAGLLSLSGQSTNIGLVVGIVIILTILIGGLGFFLYNKKE
jgi:hypothetical protein